MPLLPTKEWKKWGPLFFQKTTIPPNSQGRPTVPFFYMLRTETELNVRLAQDVVRGMLLMREGIADEAFCHIGDGNEYRAPSEAPRARKSANVSHGVRSGLTILQLIFDFLLQHLLAILGQLPRLSFAPHSFGPLPFFCGFNFQSFSQFLGSYLFS